MTKTDDPLGESSTTEIATPRTRKKYEMKATMFARSPLPRARGTIDENKSAIPTSRGRDLAGRVSANLSRMRKNLFCR